MNDGQRKSIEEICLSDDESESSEIGLLEASRVLPDIDNFLSEEDSDGILHRSEL